MVKVVIKRSTNAKKKMMAVFFKDGKKIKTTHFGASGYDDYTRQKTENNAVVILIDILIVVRTIAIISRREV